MLGDTLRDARQARGISLETAERETKIRAKYISALEDDNLAGLPGPVYARGFLRNYAAYLGLDPDAAVDMFDNQSQPTRNKIRAARGEPVPRSKTRGGDKINIQPLSPEPIDTRVRFGSSYIAISLLALPLIIAFYFIYSAYAGRNRETLPIDTTALSRPPTLTAMPIPSLVAGGTGGGEYQTPTTYVPQTPGEVITATLTATSTLAIADTSPTSRPAGDKVTVKVVTTRDAWMRVLVDGVQQYNGTLPKGSTRQWTGDDIIRIRTGRADSVQVTVNGEDIGLMGDPDNLIVEKEWDRSSQERVITR
jgi:cytoskeleton protein RodZ